MSWALVRSPVAAPRGHLNRNRPTRLPRPHRFRPSRHRCRPSRHRFRPRRHRTDSIRTTWRRSMSRARRCSDQESESRIPSRTHRGHSRRSPGVAVRVRMGSHRRRGLARPSRLPSRILGSSPRRTPPPTPHPRTPPSSYPGSSTPRRRRRRQRRLRHRPGGGPALLGRDRFRRRGGRQLGDPPRQGGVQGAPGTQEEGGAPPALTARVRPV